MDDTRNDELIKQCLSFKRNAIEINDFKEDSVTA